MLKMHAQECHWHCTWACAHPINQKHSPTHPLGRLDAAHLATATMNGVVMRVGVWWCPAGDPAKRSFQSEGTHTTTHTPQRDECAVLGASGVVRVLTTTMANCGGCGVVMVACSSPVRPHKWSICSRWPVSIAVMAPVSSMLKIHAQECHWHRHGRVHTQSTKSTVLDTP